MAFFVYILRCADGHYYVGHTDDLDRRMAQHSDGVASAFTAKRRPLTLLWASDFPSRETAFDLERKLKGWSRAKKEAFMRGDFGALPELSRNRQMGTASGDVHPSTSSG